MELRFPLYFKLVVILLGLVLFVYVLTAAQTILVLLAFSCLISLLILPLNKLLERLRIPRALAIILCLALLATIMGLLGYFVYSQIVLLLKDLQNVVFRLNDVLEDHQQFFERFFGLERGETLTFIKEQLTLILQQGSSVLSATLSVTTGVVTFVGILPVFIFFMLYYRKFFRQFILMLFDASSHREVNHTIRKVKKVAHSYLSGLITVISIVSVLNVIGLMIVGVDFALFFGVFAGVLNIIPYIGVFIGSSLPVIYVFITGGSLIKCFSAGLVLWLVQVLDNNVITPNVVGGRVSLNPFVSIVALLAGGFIWGPVGMILFIPYVAILKVIFDSIEPLHPYGFLLGEPPKKEGKGKLFGFLKKLNKNKKD
ncbi:MAG: AI-2E family transporter [Cytophagaceae bacterium]